RRPRRGGARGRARAPSVSPVSAVRRHSPMRQPVTAVVADASVAEDRRAARQRRLAAPVAIVGVGLVFTAYAFLVDFSDLGWQDEAWFLDVVHRVASGD